jgi:hypothetical protein
MAVISRRLGSSKIIQITRMYSTYLSATVQVDIFDPNFKFAMLPEAQFKGEHLWLQNKIKIELS